VKAFWLELELVTPLIAGADLWRAIAYHSKGAIPGSSVAGALRERFGETFMCSDAFPEGSVPAPPGSIKVKDPKGALGKTKYFLPAPELLSELKSNTPVEEKLKESLRELSEELYEMLDAYKGGLTKRVSEIPLKPKKKVGRFYASEAAELDYEERTSVSLLAATRSSKPGALYHQVALSPGQRFWALVLGDLPEKEFELRLGRSKSRGFGRVKVRAEEADLKPGNFLLSTVPVAFLKKPKGLLNVGTLTLWRDGVRYSTTALKPGSVLSEPQDCPWCVFVDYSWLLKEVMKK